MLSHVLAPQIGAWPSVLTVAAATALAAALLAEPASARHRCDPVRCALARVRLAAMAQAPSPPQPPGRPSRTWSCVERPGLQIVPLAGLPIVAVVLDRCAIAAIAADKLWPLMVLHVVGGAAWTVVDLFLGFVLGPIMGRLVGSRRAWSSPRG